MKCLVKWRVLPNTVWIMVGVILRATSLDLHTPAALPADLLCCPVLLKYTVLPGIRWPQMQMDTQGQCTSNVNLKRSKADRKLSQ